MQFGIGLPNLSYVDPTETLMRLAHAAQALAFDAIWVAIISSFHTNTSPTTPTAPPDASDCRRQIISSIHSPRCRFSLVRSPHHAWVSVS